MKVKIKILSTSDVRKMCPRNPDSSYWVTRVFARVGKKSEGSFAFDFDVAALGDVRYRFKIDGAPLMLGNRFRTLGDAAVAYVKHLSELPPHRRGFGKEANGLFERAAKVNRTPEITFGPVCKFHRGDEPTVSVYRDGLYVGKFTPHDENWGWEQGDFINPRNP